MKTTLIRSILSFLSSLLSFLSSYNQTSRKDKLEAEGSREKKSEDHSTDEK